MIRFIKQVLITVDALLLMIYVYTFNQVMRSDVEDIAIIKVIIKSLNFSCVDVIIFVLALMAFGLVLIVSYIILKICKIDSNDIVNNVVELREVTNEYMPIYLGYVFVAVSINNNIVFIMVFLILFIILFETQIVAFNPMFCLLGYHYYRIKTFQSTKSIEVFVMSKRNNIKDYNELQFQKLSKINEFTYIDKEA